VCVFRVLAAMHSIQTYMEQDSTMALCHLTGMEPPHPWYFELMARVPQSEWSLGETATQESINALLREIPGINLSLLLCCFSDHKIV